MLNAWCMYDIHISGKRISVYYVLKGGGGLNREALIYIIRRWVLRAMKNLHTLETHTKITTRI